jgi:hypothetical protein
MEGRAEILSGSKTTALWLLPSLPRLASGAVFSQLDTHRSDTRPLGLQICQGCMTVVVEVASFFPFFLLFSAERRLYYTRKKENMK